ncbi:MAG: hypothetical protein KDE09_19025 [Anaerolineales bacterium]|nr:hypothetical protein [Anaerolineales bacterium]
MKDGSSRRKKILGLIGVVILALGAFSVVAFGARMLAGHFAGNSQQMAIAAVEPETGELVTVEVQRFDRVHGDMFGNGEVVIRQDFHRPPRDFHHHSHRGFFLGAIFGGMIHLAILALAGYGAFALFQRMRRPAAAAPEARVINEDDEFDEPEIKVG